MFRFFVCVGLCLVISGCGTIYRSSAVTPGDGVTVVEISAQSVMRANATPYTPKSLPAAFSGTTGIVLSARSTLQLPKSINAANSARRGPLPLHLPPTLEPGPYKIGVGDVVLLTKPSNRSMEGATLGVRQTFAVQEDGAINIPDLGRIALSDATLEQAEARLFDRFVAAQLDPSFGLEVAEFNARHVSVGGAVGAAAIVPVTLTPLYLDAALAAAGGITAQDQATASIRIYRAGALYQIPLSTLYAQPDLLKTRLFDGDALFVDEAYDLTQAKVYFEQQISLAIARQSARQLALAELESEVALRRAQLEEVRESVLAARDLGVETRDHVYLTGEFQTQTRFPLPYDRQASLADALFSDARGIRMETGDVSQIYVMRGNPSGITAWHLDTRDAARLVLATQFQLRPNDVIFVAQQPITRWNRAVSQLLPSLIDAQRVEDAY